MSKATKLTQTIKNIGISGCTTCEAELIRLQKALRQKDKSKLKIELYPDLHPTSDKSHWIGGWHINTNYRVKMTDTQTETQKLKGQSNGNQ